MKLKIKRVKSGHRKGDLYWSLYGENNEFICGSRPETFQTRAGLDHNRKLVAGIETAEVVDLTAGE